MSSPLTTLDPLINRNTRPASRFSRLSFMPNSLNRQSILRIGDIEGHQGNRLYNLIADFIVFIITTLEISVVIYLSYTHFDHSSDHLMALAMLLPILLNFVGVTYFLSDKNERRELETASSSKCATDFLQFPVVGPVFTALKVLRVSCGCSQHRNYERLEASAIKMRQACGFFSAGPEALVQLTVILTNQPKTNQDLDSYLEIFAVILFTITLAESNCYSPLSKYYKMFGAYEVNDWKLANVSLWQKAILFLHAVTSIGSRMISSAGLKAGLLYFYREKAFPLILIICLLTEILIRLLLFYICRFIRHFWLGKEIPSGCHVAINYAWRSTILDYGFQSTNIVKQIFFYMENIGCFIFWTIAVSNRADAWVKEIVFIPLTITYSALMGFSILFLTICHYFQLIRLSGPFKKKSAVT